MKKYIGLLFGAFIVFCIPKNTFALEIQPGKHFKVKSTNNQGVPLHRESRSSMFTRLPNGSTVFVLRIENDNWLYIDAESGLNGWIVKKYVVEEAIDEDPVDTGDNSAKVWTSHDLCNTVVLEGGRLPKADNTLRIATWNIRWYPDGIPGFEPDSSKKTNLAWLSCVIAYMDADVIAVQELKTANYAISSIESVLDGVEGYTGEVWDYDLEQCSNNVIQHNGFLWNGNTVKLKDNKDMWQFNAAATNSSEECTRFRPGRYAYVESNFENGADFHIISVHSDSGTEDSEYENRFTVLKRLDGVATDLTSTDSDIIVLGDFNTMGSESHSTSNELSTFRSTVSQENPGFEDLPITPQCTEYYNRKGGWLDHIVATNGMAEVNDRQVRVLGYCALANCERLDSDNLPEAYKSLSDHCPILVDIQDKDIDQ